MTRSSKLNLNFSPSRGCHCTSLWSCWRCTTPARPTAPPGPSRATRTRTTRSSATPYELTSTKMGTSTRNRRYPSRRRNQRSTKNTTTLLPSLPGHPLLLLQGHHLLLLQGRLHLPLQGRPRHLLPGLHLP